ncbi:MBL fold metallo-hydrolase [Nakamurella endophytica]|uniref:MBL fold metallo-hydrolase n=1 Tax=Nakamurella endophytica TaxID=1748367 RepID=A0A917WM74_9ACTN|nr:MBL fold metallo-hydrolase [Nakamurella endophytica]GGM14654.1 MBL fold metallo-hydrolase [Nakamurella endophytica]
MSDLLSPTLHWLGQAGFALRSGETCVLFDPYLSDLCLRVHGLHRTVEAPVRPAQLGADLVLVSHWHEDHLDLDSAAEFVAAGARYLVPPSCAARLIGAGIDPAAVGAIRAGESVRHGDVSVIAVPARHAVPGFLTEDAVGFLVDLAGTRTYHSGDTDYDRSVVAAAGGEPIDVALLCVNGTGGNMNAWEAAALAAQLAPRRAVPMHFGMWSASAYGPGSTLDPEVFADLYRRLRPGADVVVPRLGHEFAVRG